MARTRSYIEYGVRMTRSNGEYMYLFCMTGRSWSKAEAKYVANRYSQSMHPMVVVRKISTAETDWEEVSDDVKK